ncbi:MAG: porin [Desulfuromonadaceae bacterium]|nr:porin [Desulfuromonadaceae bacterium]MDD5105006.1 porin [Desulfuromonadaceae bacterium]
MNFKKTAAIAAAVGAFGAISVPAMALENEFHGLYKFMGYQGNFFNGVTGKLSADPAPGFMAEQRARLQYIAKANADFKLVTHFELDTRFGGKTGGYLGTTGDDAGNLDADKLTLETKNIYVDFNCPLTGANVKLGMQPWADSYQSLFLLADMTGAHATKNFGPAKASLGWFRFDDNTVDGGQVGRKTADLFVLGGKYTVSKDVTIGASYYYVNNDTTLTVPAFDRLHMFGLDADIKFGPANIKPFVAFQSGDRTATTDLNGYLLGAVSKTKAGPGSVNLSAIYLSGDSNGTTKKDSFTAITSSTSYFVPAKMWLLVRSGNAINSSTSILGNDLTVGGRGLIGVFAGYEGTMGKMFYNANLGYAETAESRNSEKSSIGTELNAQVGYKMLDNVSVSAALAYAFLGDGMNSATTADRISGFGVANADDPYAINLQLSYTF